VDALLVGDVLDAMRQLARDGMTMVVVTHEIGFAREAGTRWRSWMRGDRRIRKARGGLFEPRHERTRLFLSKVL
jgi:ABC-type polar amino acid transport system ATPase subunit